MLTQTLTRQGMGRSMISYGHQMAQPHPANLVEACASSRLAMALVQHKWRDTLAQNPTGDTMALLLKLESKIINLDNVFEIEDYGDRMALFYAVASSDIAGTQQPAYAEVDGAAAQALRRWLSEHTIDILAQAAGDAWSQTDRAVADPQEQASGAASDIGRLAQMHGGNSAPGQAEALDQPFYGAARMQQLHGAGGSPTNEASESSE